MTATTDTSETVRRTGDVSRVIFRYGCFGHLVGKTAVEVFDTGNGFLARFPAHDSVTQDYWLCMDYSQAHDLILALSAFKKEIGFL